MRTIKHCWNATGTAIGRLSPSWWSATKGPFTTPPSGSCSVEDANDITQIVFLKVAEQLDDYDPQYKFFSWIYRIAVNESLNLLRRNKREEALDDDVDLPGSERCNPESQFGEAEVSRRIRSALMNLPTNDRIVLSLRHFSECSYQEIGQILDLDEKTVKSRLYEARHRLRDVLKDLRPN